MPSPGAADQHRNQVNRNERGTESDRQTEKKRERTRTRERLKKGKGRKLKREGMLSAADPYQNSSLPYRALIRLTIVQLMHINKQANRKALFTPVPFTSSSFPLLHHPPSFPWELAVEPGNQGVSMQNTSSCQIEDLIEIRVKTQNHMFVITVLEIHFRAQFLVPLGSVKS